MSLLLSGAKTIVFAGTEMQCLEIYTGEAYTIGLNFTDAVGTAIDISTWTLGVEAGFYSVDTVIYNDEAGEIHYFLTVNDPWALTETFEKEMLWRWLPGQQLGSYGSEVSEVYAQ